MKKRKNEKHGMSGTTLYNNWWAMKDRCNNSNYYKYHLYGGKGIRVCQEWEESFTVYRDWAYANGYRDGLTIDRVDSDKGYCPENCRYITLEENSRRAMLGKGQRYTYKGRSLSLPEWVEITGVSYSTLHRRIDDGWSIDRVLSTSTKGKVYAFKGEEKTLAEWSKVTDIRIATLRRRINVSGWSVERALTTPVDREKKYSKRVDK